MTGDWETLLPLLVHIQAHLEDDLSLAALSRKAGLSPFHLQRRFKAAVGETPKAYTSRLRLERGAFRLLLHDSTVLDIALECGFQSHETFLRAFRRRFGRAPGDYREWVRGQLTAPYETASEDHAEQAPAFEISATKVVPLRSVHLAFRRHVGPYELVPESLFDDLEAWAGQRQLPGPRIWMGIGHDAPNTTPPERLRFDAALVVPGPFIAEGSIGPPGSPRRSLRRHYPRGTVCDAPRRLRSDLSAGAGAARLPVGWPAGGRDLPHHSGERAAPDEPHGSVFAGGGGRSVVSCEDW